MVISFPPYFRGRRGVVDRGIDLLRGKKSMMEWVKRGNWGPKRAEEKKPGYYFCSLSV